MDIHNQLAQLGLKLPTPPKPVAAYVPALRTGNLLFISGQLPFHDGQLSSTGVVPSTVSLPQAQQAACQCILNALAIVDHHLQGNWNNFDRIIRLGVFVASDTGYGEQPKVANGASELLQTLFGEQGTHVRAAVGVNTLPLNAPVEIELLVSIKP